MNNEDVNQHQHQHQLPTRALPSSLMSLLSNHNNGGLFLSSSSNDRAISPTSLKMDDTTPEISSWSPSSKSTTYQNATANANDVSLDGSSSGFVNNNDALAFLQEVNWRDDDDDDVEVEVEEKKGGAAFRSLPSKVSLASSSISSSGSNPDSSITSSSGASSQEPSTASLFGQSVFVAGSQPTASADSTTSSVTGSNSSTPTTSSSILDTAIAVQTQLGQKANHPQTITTTNKTKKHQPNNNKRRRELTENKRVERNGKEQKRSTQINDQFSELCQLLSHSGIVVPKGTKSAILEVTLEYIRVLKDRQQQMELTTSSLAEQMQGVAQGKHGEFAAKALQHAATKNGILVTDPTSSSITAAQPNQVTGASSSTIPAATDNDGAVTSADVFRNAPVGTAIASLGGKLIDCNALFCQIAKCTRQKLTELTVFNLIARDDMPQAFAQLSALMTAKEEKEGGNCCHQKEPLVFSSAFSSTIGLRLSFVNNEEGEKNLICVTLQAWDK